jgi:hypothetical protein
MCKRSNTFTAYASALTLATLVTFTAFAPAHAGGHFISALHCVDIAYDESRGLLYITSGDRMLRYQLSSRSFQTPVKIRGASLMGMDISPDGSTAAIADANARNDLTYAHFVNLDTLNVNTVSFPEDGSIGTFTTAYGSNGDLLVSTTYQTSSGPTPLWLYDPSNGSETDLAQISGNRTMLTPSAGGDYVALAEGNSSQGPFGYYQFSTGTLDLNGSSANFNFEIGVNKDATLYAIPTYMGTLIANAGLQLTGTVIGTNGGNIPIAAAFSPTRDRAYFPFTGTTDVYVYDTKNWTQVRTYDFKDTFQWNGGYAFGQGRTKLSKDGSLLFVTVTGGVRYRYLKL